MFKLTLLLCGFVLGLPLIQAHSGEYSGDYSGSGVDSSGDGTSGEGSADNLVEPTQANVNSNKELVSKPTENNNIQQEKEAKHLIENNSNDNYIEIDGDDMFSRRKRRSVHRK